MRISPGSGELMRDPSSFPLTGATPHYKQKLRPHSFLTPKLENFREKKKEREKERKE